MIRPLCSTNRNNYPLSMGSKLSSKVATPKNSVFEQNIRILNEIQQEEIFRDVKKNTSELVGQLQSYYNASQKTVPSPPSLYLGGPFSSTVRFVLNY
jgi:hypothetical protein